MERLSVLGTRRNIVALIAVLVSLAVVILYFGTSPASFKKLSCQVKGALAGSDSKTSLADAGCQSQSSGDGETYFVSCGGFF